MLVGPLRRKEKQPQANKEKDVNKKMDKICQDYKSRLMEYRDELLDLNKGKTEELDENRNGLCQEQLGKCKSPPLSPTLRKEQCNSADFIRQSMHWEEFFGSSLDLAPSLLSIFDSIVQGTKHNEEGDQSDETTQSHDQEGTNHIGDTNKENSHSGCSSVKINVGQQKCDNSSPVMEVSHNDTDNLINDAKKRPLSLGSVSSSSSSSLPRHIRKRPNLSQFDPVALGRSDMEKLDNLLYIDDDAPSATTDEEMSVDTDMETSSQKLNVQDTTKCSTPSLASLSSENDNHENRKLGTTESSATNHTDQTPVTSINHLRLSSLYATPNSDSSFCSTPSRSPGVGRSPYTDNTPNRSSSVSRDGPGSPKYITYVQRVVAEIVDTEASYVQYLHQILYGYLEFFESLPTSVVTVDERLCLFGNIQDIYDFSKKFLEELEECEADPIRVAQCFVRNNEGFSIYAKYCTNYPNSVEVLTKVMLHADLSKVLKEKQMALGHNLPLGSYLLKPVQRVLKYHLLLHNLLKNYNKKDAGYEVLNEALNHMTGMAQHINEMKRKHEHAVRVQEIQSQLEEYDGEDLTRLGELVLEGSFRIYGAKSSRQVFLFEKGILITKKKEDSMLSSKGLIFCSNLMLVESIPKEPLSFQIIPFDNPKGQHMLQVRNLELKRKWCQEIKRLIIDSYKDKIPEKVKGLVMQLGKSKEEDAAKGSALELKKFHHHNAPEYLEKRQRIRRKSGTLIPEILKPQRRKAIRRAGKEEDIDGSGRCNSPQPREDEDFSSMELADITESSPVNSQEIKSPTLSKTGSIGRSRSFKTAVKIRPLASTDLDDEEIDVISDEKKTDKVPLRSKSFRLATKLRPLRSVDLTNERISVSSPTTPVSSRNSAFEPTDLKAGNSQEVFPHTDSVDGQCDKANSQHSSNDSNDSMSENSENKSLLNAEPSSPSTNQGLEKFKSFYNFKPLTRTLDPKQYFKSNIGSNTLANNLRRDSNSPTAFHNAFAKRIAISNNLKSRLESKPLSLTKPHALSSSFNVIKADKNRSASERNINIMNDELNDNPWVPNNKTGTRVNQRNNYVRRQRSRSTDTELDSGSRDNLDWMVYANRNSLPVFGYSTEDIPKLYKHCASPLSKSLDVHSTENVFSQSPKSTPQSPHRHSMSVADTISRESLEFSEAMQKLNDSVNMLNRLSASDDKKEDTVDVLTSISSRFNHYSAQGKRQSNLTRSNSTPCARLGSKFHQPRSSSVRSASVDIDSIIVDHEQIVAEMEDYLQKSDPNLLAAINSNKFPTGVAQITSDDEMDSKRDSCISVASSSSYESHTSYDEDSFVIESVSCLKPESQQSVSQRRSGSYDNKSKNEANDNPKSEVAQSYIKECRTSLLSLNSWFLDNKSRDDQNDEEPDLQTVLHHGDLGGPEIGQRMAEPEPIYLLPSVPLSRSKERLLENGARNDKTSSLKADYELPDPNATALGDNLNMQQSDSAFSIRDGCNSDDSPRTDDSNDSKCQRSESDSSGESFYERRLSQVFDEGDAFRDSAVYCEMEHETHPHESQVVSPAKPSRLPIKEYVQKLEEESKYKPVQTNKIAQRQPTELIRKRMLSLQNSQYRRSLSRPCSEEREIKHYGEKDMRYINLTSRGSPSDTEEEGRFTRSRSLGRNCLKSSQSLGHLDQISTDVDNLVMKGWVRSLIHKFQTSTSPNT